MYRVLLFDLDGTLTASGEGITKSVQYALHKMGREAEDLKALEVFVGPPLLEQFMRYCGMSEEEAVQAVRFYRERYNVTGLFENSPYDGVREMLETLRARGFILGVASSKPDGMVKRILEHFEAEVACIGVTYGYGSYEELSQAGADKIVRSVKELEEYLLNG